MEGSQYGRTTTGNFIQSQLPFVHANTTLVTIFAGGNDVDTIIAALGGGAGGTDQTSQMAYINSQIDLFGQEFASLINQVRTLAPATGTKAERLAAMRAAVLPCAMCPNLAASRTQVVALTKSATGAVDVVPGGGAPNRTAGRGGRSGGALAGGAGPAGRDR